MLAPSPLPRSLEASFRDIGSERPATRASAIRDLVRHALAADAVRARAIPALERLLRDDGAAAVRSEAAVALADLGAREGLSALLVSVEDADPAVRQMALAALGELGDPRATQRLSRALRDARPEVRYQAVIAFARVAKDDPTEVAAALAHAMDDPDEAIRYIALRVAEEQLADGGPCLDDRLEVRAEQLIEAPNVTVAVAAALYLARLGRSRGLEVVMDVVAERVHTAELEDEEACVELTGELSLSAAVPYLERRAWGRRRLLRRVFSWGAGDRSSCAWHARIALARMNHPRARAEILGDLGSSRRETREAAVVAVGRARLGEARPTLERLRGSVDDALVNEALVRLAVDPTVG
jgi:HEAT repeat protein